MIGFPFTCAHLTPPGLRRLAVNWVSHCQGTPYGPPMGPLSVFFPQDSHVECSTHTYTANDVEYVYLETTPTTSVQKSGCGHHRHRRPSAVTHPRGGVFTGVHLRNPSLRFLGGIQTWSTDHVCETSNDLEYMYLWITSTIELRKSGCGRLLQKGGRQP
jgi:hypothetical protein